MEEHLLTVDTEPNDESGANIDASVSLLFGFIEERVFNKNKYRKCGEMIELSSTRSFIKTSERLLDYNQP